MPPWRPPAGASCGHPQTTGTRGRRPSRSRCLPRSSGAAWPTPRSSARRWRRTSVDGPARRPANAGETIGAHARPFRSLFRRSPVQPARGRRWTVAPASALVSACPCDGSARRRGDRVARPHRDAGADLTRSVARLRDGTPVEPVEGQSRPLDDDDLARWESLGLAMACADLVGVMRGTLALATDYARERKQYGATIGSFQAVQHLLADACVAMEGSRSISLHAAWAVDALARRCARCGSLRAKGVLRPCRALGMRDVDPGARRHRQHLGVPGPRLFAPGAVLDRDPRWHRRQPAAGPGRPRRRRRPWTSVTRRRRPRSACAFVSG